MVVASKIVGEVAAERNQVVDNGNGIEEQKYGDVDHRYV